MEIAGRRLPRGRWWDWELIIWDGGQPRPAAGYHLMHRHGREIIFTGPGFVSCPAASQDPVFREPIPEETARLRRVFGETPPVVVAFEAAAGGSAPASCLIAAEALDIVPGLVQRRPCAPAEAAAGPRDWPGPPLPTD
ncbi:hypothetical protein [Streptomyces roseochromogenus]|uniref:Uncharacterized protein n=1 Tax=Streptomyces roseochromogenus subsp. oscitans DS 12.976 TaxID=1352936 RepID=V6KSP7_STRRC|nr:hypothetical protein [Streptomyces roseochromogenus]EST34441.1 hypothetical protein M878_10625 [Streptomyces roseochromogenus subsp. oscitans DS 12.976]